MEAVKSTSSRRTVSRAAFGLLQVGVVRLQGVQQRLIVVRHQRCQTLAACHEALVGTGLGGRGFQRRLVLGGEQVLSGARDSASVHRSWHDWPLAAAVFHR
ncbi:hypothetical protein ACRHM7_17775 [Chromohalobacter israelensis]|uniref:hypothetical protein n=1 Tax=Chromohalobacter israelensis TaxID=141390 RepID=UPI003D791E29